MFSWFKKKKKPQQQQQQVIQQNEQYQPVQFQQQTSSSNNKQSSPNKHQQQKAANTKNNQKQQQQQQFISHEQILGNDPDLWIYESIVQYLISPIWKIPIYDFIDSNCIVFEDVEENHFAYTDVHIQFKKLIDENLEVLVIELGISYEQFLQQVEKGLNIPQHKKVFEQLILVDNFQVFKKMMIKRNKELEFEVMQEYEKEVMKSQKTAGISDQDKKQLEKLQLEKDQAEIEHAIAMSIALQEEMQKLQQQEDADLEQALKQSQLDYLNHQENNKKKQQQQQEEEEHNNQLKQQELEKQDKEKRLQEQQQKLREKKQKDKELAEQKAVAEQQQQKEKEQQQQQFQHQQQQQQEKEAIIQQQKQEQMMKQEEQKMQQSQSNIQQSNINSSSQQVQKLSGSVGGSGGGGYDLPPIQTQKKLDTKTLDELMQERQNVAKQLEEIKVDEDKQQNQKQQEEDIFMRKKRLQQQRNLILQKKKQEREEELQKYKEEQQTVQKLPSKPIGNLEQRDLFGDPQNKFLQESEQEKRKNLLSKIKNELNQDA